MKKKKLIWAMLPAAVSLLILAGLQRLLIPKYAGKVVEGNLTGEYYKDATKHDVIILGDCESYENISPITMWENYGITTFIRGNSQQLIGQSYYLLRDTLKTESPKVVVLNVASMQHPLQDNEAYNRMTLDGMRWSLDKLRAIEESKMEGEHLLDYIFPLLRYHSRWSELSEADFRYYFQDKQVSHNGYYLRADVRPAGTLPTERRLSNYAFDALAWKYLDQIRLLCKENDIALVLTKAPSLYPAWHDQWNEQILDYAEEYQLLYLNDLEHVEEIGIDYAKDTYDGGLHLNVYGAEKLGNYLGGILQETYDLTDHRSEEDLKSIWAEKVLAYNEMKSAQEEEFAATGVLKQFSE